MLADQRSQALVKNFPGQWLFLRNIARIQPDPRPSRISTRTCATRWRRKQKCSSRGTLREDRSVGICLSTDYTFVNQRLAEHYGIKASTAPSSAAFRSPIRSGMDCSAKPAS